MPNEVTLVNGELVCTCGAKAQDNSSESKRFNKRHPGKCSERRDFTKQLAQGIRSVDYDVAGKLNWRDLSDQELEQAAKAYVVSTNLAQATEALYSGQLQPRAEQALRRLLERK